MESLISSYGIPFYQFQKACIEYNAVVAGSSALYSYLKQENIDPGFEPNDIDIFLPSRMYRNDRPGRPLSIPSDEFSYTLLSNGFVENIRINSGDYYDNINSIASVITYTNSSGKNIQIISINYNGPLTSYISEQFDISVCISWWNASINKFETLCPALTLRKEMYITRNDAMSKLRIEKYKQRGFVVVSMPSAIYKEKDARENMIDSKFDGITVCDIINLDDFPLSDYLKGSENNIVIKSGEKYYAFDRNSLRDYMKNKSHYINTTVGEVYETPLKQCITAEAFHCLSYADYSIYELHTAYSDTTTKTVKSLFHLECLTVKQWLENTCGREIIVPTK